MNNAIIAPKKSDFDTFSWKNAPFAFIANYHTYDMPRHEGRLAWSAETLCCGEKVNGGEYGDDEFCPCCHKPIEWSEDAAKEYKTPFERKAKEEYETALEDYKAKLPEILNALTEGLSPNKEGLIEFGKRLADAVYDIDAIENGKNDYLDPRITLSVHSKPPFTTHEIKVYLTDTKSKGDETYKATITLRKDEMFVRYTKESDHWFFNREGDRDFEVVTEWEKVEKIPYSPELVAQAILANDTPEKLQNRENIYQKEQIKQELVGKIVAMKSSRKNDSEVLKNIFSIMAKYKDLGGSYNMQDLVNRLEMSKDNTSCFYNNIKEAPIVFEKTGSEWSICEYQKYYTKSEDGTPGIQYSKANTIAHGEVFKELEDVPDIVKSKAFPENMEINKFSPAIKEHLDGIYSILEHNKEFEVVNEGAYPFYCDDLVRNWVYDDLEIIEQGDTPEYNVEDGDIWLEAFLESGELVLVAEYNDGSENIIKLTPTEKEILMSVIGANVQEKTMDLDKEE